MKKPRINDHLGLVRFQATRLNKRTPPNITYDDLYAAGLVGLDDAINKFDNKKKVKFSTYASIRIYGAMIDEMRETSWLTRWYSDRYKKTGFPVREMLTYSKVFEKSVSVTKQRYMIGRSADLERAFNELSMRERKVLQLYYHDGLTMWEIADLFGVTESRISQTCLGAIESLKTMMRAG